MEKIEICPHRIQSKAKSDIIYAIVMRRDYRYTHDELMRMTRKELIEVYNSFQEDEKA